MNRPAEDGQKFVVLLGVFSLGMGLLCPMASARAERRRLVAQMRAGGWTWVEVAGAIRERYGVNARVAFRFARNWSQSQVADEWCARWPEEPKTFKNVSCWERWPESGYAPSLETLDRLAQIYQCSAADLLVGVSDYRHLDGSGRLPGLPAVDEPNIAGEEAESVNRRDLVKLGGAALTTSALCSLSIEADRMRALLDSTSVSHDRLTYFENFADRSGVDVIRVPPLDVLEAATAHFQSVRRLIEERQSTSRHTRLVRVAAMLSTVVGEILFNDGRFLTARAWYSTALHAALDVGDQYLADIALAGLAYLPTYSGRAQEVLDLVLPRLDRGWTNNPAASWLWGMAARAHAARGDRDEFERSIANAQSSLAGSSSEQVRPGIFSFVPAKLAFYEANGYARLRDSGKAAGAAERALAAYDMTETTEPALVQLDHATAFAYAGEAEEACRLAAHAIARPTTFYGATVSSRAADFDALLTEIRAPRSAEWTDAYEHARHP